MDTPARTALQDLLMTWNGDKLELRTTSGQGHIGYSWLNQDMSLVFLNKQPGAEDGTAVVVDRIEAVRFLEAYPKADDLTAGDDHPGAVTEPETTSDMDFEARVAQVRARNEGLAALKALGPRPQRIAAGREFRAMVAIEVAERTAKLALQAIEANRPDIANTLLQTLIADTSTRSATEIRNQEDADVISAGARAQMISIRERVGVIPE
jgi:hypothetical protein